METKQFTIEKEGGLYRIFNNGKIIPILDGQPIVDLLNELAKDKRQQRILIDSLKKENQKLKLRLKDLGVEYF